MSSIVDATALVHERDLPRATPTPTAWLRAVQNNRAVLIPLPEVSNASALVAEAIDDVHTTGKGLMAHAVANIEQEGASTIASVEAEAASVIHQAQIDLGAVLAGMGLMEPVEFEDGLEVVSSRFTVRYDGAIYYPKAPVPFTTSDVFDPEQWQLVQGLTAADLGADSGAALVAGKLSYASQKRQLIDILNKDIYFSVSNVIPLSHSGDCRSLIQAALNDAATSGRAGMREVAFRARGEYEISGHLVIPKGVRLIFDGDGRFKPSASFTEVGTSDALRSYGTVPGGGYAPTSDISFGSYKVPAGEYAGLFDAGDYVWLQSTCPIDTSPNTNGIVKAQFAKVIAIDDEDLILDRLVEYDFPAATTFFGKADIITGVTVENFVWGDPSMTVRSGRGIDFRYHDGLKIQGGEIGWSRTESAVGSETDTTNLNAINLSCCSNATVDGLKFTRVAWYGIAINGACHNVKVRNIEAHLVRHAVSLNWNGPGEPIDVLISDSTSTISSAAGFDGHDVGRDITYRKLRVRGAIGEGVQTRTSNVLFDDITVEDSGHALLVYGHDIASHHKLKNITIRAFRAKRCVTGINSVAPARIDGFDIEGCTTAGIQTMGGTVENGSIRDSNIAIFYHPGNRSAAAKQPLTISNVEAPASPAQTIFLRSTAAFTDQNVKLRDVRARGYASSNLITRTTSTYIADIDHSGCEWGADPREGTVTLSGGTATVNNDNIVVPGSATASRVFRSSVEVQRISAGGTVGSYTVSVSEGQFTITSSSGSDTSTLRWRIL